MWFKFSVNDEGGKGQRAEPVDSVPWLIKQSSTEQDLMIWQKQLKKQVQVLNKGTQPIYRYCGGYDCIPLKSNVI